MKPNEILMKWALRPAENDSFCDGGEGSGHGFDAAQLWLVQMVTAALVRVPNRLRCLPSNAGQVLAADRCGISVSYASDAEGLNWCRGRKWLDFPSSLYLGCRASEGRNTEGRTSQPWMHPLCQKAPSPSDCYPRTLDDLYFHACPVPTQSLPHPAQWHAAIENLPLFSFTRWEL